MEIPVCLCVYAHKHAPMNVDFLPVDLFVCIKYSLKAWRAGFGKFKKHCLKCVIFFFFAFLSDPEVASVVYIWLSVSLLAQQYFLIVKVSQYSQLDRE